MADKRYIFKNARDLFFDMMFFAVMASVGYLLFHQLYKEIGESRSRIKGHSITVTSKGHEYIIFETSRSAACCTHSASCPCQYKHQVSVPVPNDSIAGPRKNLK